MLSHLYDSFNISIIMFERGGGGTLLDERLLDPF